MNSGALKRAKRQIRRTVLEERDALSSGVRAEWGERIAGRAVELPEVRDARAVMLFSSFGSEVPTGPLIERLRERGIVVALPRIEDGELVPVAYAPGDPVRATSFGAVEPIGVNGLEPASLDVVGVPGVAFDRLGGRDRLRGRVLRPVPPRAARVPGRPRVRPAGDRGTRSRPGGSISPSRPS